MLYLVATPIGNLGDMTFRAVDVLKNVDLIASEDSRKTSVLLKHYEIHKPQTALNNFNERKVVPKLLERLERGENIALVTDAGTPGISDPGYLLTHAALEAGNHKPYAIQSPCKIREEQHNGLHPCHLEQFGSHISHLHKKIAEKSNDLTVDPIYNLTEDCVGDKIPYKHFSSASFLLS